MTSITSIQLDKKRIVRLLLVCTGFVVCGVWMYGLSDVDFQQIHHRRLRSLTVVHGVGLAGITIFGLVAISLFAKLFDKSPGFVMSSDGLIDNTGLFAHGFISWTEIAGIEIRPLGNQPMVYLMLTDNEQYFARRGFIKRILFRITPRFGPSPIMIAWTMLEIDLDDLTALILERLKDSLAGQRLGAS